MNIFTLDEKDKILGMAAKGMSTTEIAKALNKGKGEVDLILSLEKRGKSDES